MNDGAVERAAQKAERGEIIFAIAEGGEFVDACLKPVSIGMRAVSPYGEFMFFWTNESGNLDGEWKASVAYPCPECGNHHEINDDDPDMTVKTSDGMNTANAGSWVEAISNMGSFILQLAEKNMTEEARLREMFGS